MFQNGTFADFCGFDTERGRNMADTSLKLFENQNIRTSWDEDAEKWYFSVVDVIAVLTDSKNPRNYWKVMKHRLTKSGNELVTRCNQLKLVASDGKRYSIVLSNRLTLH